MPTSGGKKQSQRTKGNVKPSSSSQAAELLVSQGTAATSGFIGFGQGPKYVPASETLDDMDSSLDSDFRMVLRKLTKRDSVTKIKSLQELSEICGTKDEESIKAVLPFWPRIYNKMTMDIDYRVREAAQHAMSNLVKKAGRNIAPYLKSMMGAWLLNQCDTYPTVASAAQLAFTNSFSPHKQKDVWSFSKDNILEYLSDNILKQTPKSLSDPKATDPEDMENKYVRVVTCSLLAVRKLLQALTTEQVASVTEQLKNMLEDPKFWKHGKHKANMVKGAVYGCISGLFQCQPELCENYVSKMAPLVFHNLDEKDPVICVNIWEAALSLVNYLPSCWQHINIQKGFMPKLKTVLENGCHGNAVVIGPSLLPFISKVPPDLFPDGDKFFLDFFTHFKTGLSESSVQTNRSECNALVRAYMECANYVVLKETTPSTFLADQVLPLVESSLLEDKSQLHKTPLYIMVSQLLGPAQKGDTIPGALEFWNHLAGTMLDTLDTKDTETVEPTLQRTRIIISEKLLSLVKALYYPDFEPIQKSGKVSFKTEEDADISFSAMKLEDTGQRSTLGQHAAGFIHRIVQQTFESAYSDGNTDSLQLLSRLIELTNGDSSIVSDMVGCVKHDTATVGKDFSVSSSDINKNENNSSTQERDINQENENKASLEYFVFDVCIDWVRKLEKQETSEHDLENVINILGFYMKTLEVQKTNELLEKLNEILADIKGFMVLLSKLLSISESLPVVEEWIRGPLLGSRLVRVTQDLCCVSQPSDSKMAVRGWNIVSMALSSFRDSELLISRETTDSLLQAVLERLTQLDWVSADASCDMDRIARAVQKYYSHKACLGSSVSVDLLVEFFSISVAKEQQLTGETKELLQSIWSSGFSLIFKDTDNPVRSAEVWSRAADIVTSFVNKSLKSLPVLQGLLSCVRDLLTVMLTSSDSSDVMTFCCQLFVEISTQVPNQVWEYLCVKGDYPAVPQKGPPSISYTRTLYTTLYNAHLLELARSLEGTGDIEGDGEGVSWGREALEHVLKCCQGLAIVEMSLEAGEQAIQSSEAEAARKLKTTLFSLISTMDTGTSQSLWQLLLASFDREPDICLSIGTLTAALKNRSDVTFYVVLSDIEDRCSNLTASCHYFIRSCLPSLRPFDLPKPPQLLTALVLSCTPEQDVFSGSAGILSLISESVAMVTGHYVTEVSELLLGTLEQILVVKETREEMFLYNSNLAESSDTAVLINADIARFLCSVVSLISETLLDKHWDFVMCSLASWIQSLDESRSVLLSSTALKTLTVSVCNLVSEVAKCVNTVTPGKGYPENLVTEWNEFFSDSIFDALLPIYVEVCGHLKNQSKSTDSLLLKAVCSAVSNIPKTRILEHGLPPLLSIDDTSSLPDELQTLVNHVGYLMLHRNRATQMSAWHILNRIIGELPQYDKEGSSEEIATDHQEPTARGPPLFLMKVINECSEALHSLLEDTEIDRHRILRPEDAGYHPTLGYLLSWQLIVQFFTSAPAQIRQEYARYLEEHHLVEILMWCLYKLMPANPDKMFDIPPDMIVHDSASSTEVQHIACNLYKLALKNMPAMVRNWWKTCDRKTAAYVDKFTTKNVSNILCVQEIQSVQTTGKELDGMTVKTRSATREVIATYCLGEVTIEMVITLPPNYPLGPISVKSEKRVGVSAQQWEKWLLQLNIFLQHQNGNIIDGLELWKNNIDKKFEGVDDCMICFSVLHGTNFQLPRITCRTCKKKFHSACLYKWFHTSHNSTCPLCRNVF